MTILNNPVLKVRFNIVSNNIVSDNIVNDIIVSDNIVSYNICHNIVDDNVHIILNNPVL